MQMIKKLYHLMASMNCGLFLLLLLGLSAALGSAFLPALFFKTRLFIGLLILLSLNLSLCTLNQLIKLGRILSLRPKLRPGLVRRIGLVMLHAGMVMIIAGAILYAYCGQGTQISLCRHESVDVSRVMSVKEPFTMYLDEFKIMFNKDGSNAQYYSYITVLKNGKPQQKSCISVNQPLHWGGIKAYQMSFGYRVKVQASSAAGGQDERLYKEGEFLHIKESPYRLKIYRYLPDYDPALGMTSRTMQPNDPHIIFSVYKNDQLKGVGAVRLGESVKLDDKNHVVFSGVEPYTVLKLKSDPGMPLVLTGGLVLMLGLALSWIGTNWPGKRKAGCQIETRADERNHV